MKLKRSFGEAKNDFNRMIFLRWVEDPPYGSLHFRQPEIIFALSFSVVRGLPRRDKSRLAMTGIVSGCLKNEQSILWIDNAKCERQINLFIKFQKK